MQKSAEVSAWALPVASCSANRRLPFSNVPIIQVFTLAERFQKEVQRHYYALALYTCNSLKVLAQTGGRRFLFRPSGSMLARGSQNTRIHRRALELAAGSTSFKAPARPVRPPCCRGYPDIVPGVDQCIQRPGQTHGTSPPQTSRLCACKVFWPTSRTRFPRSSPGPVAVNL